MEEIESPRFSLTWSRKSSKNVRKVFSASEMEKESDRIEDIRRVKKSKSFEKNSSADENNENKNNTLKGKLKNFFNRTYSAKTFGTVSKKFSKKEPVKRAMTLHHGHFDSTKSTERNSVRARSRTHQSIESFFETLLEMQKFETDIIFEENKNPQEDEDQQVPRSATLYQLLKWLVTRRHVTYINIFLLSYRCVGINHFDILTNLVKIYKETESEDCDCKEFVDIKKNMITSFTRSWLNGCTEEELATGENQSLLEKVLECFTDDPRLMSLGFRLWRKINAQKKEKNQETKKNIEDLVESLCQIPDKNSSTVNLFSIPPERLALHLGIIELDIFSKINLTTEFSQQAWTKKDAKIKAPGIMNLIERFNHVSCWVATEIVTKSTPKLQKKQLKQFIKVAQECRKMNNLNTTMEILSGINHCSVSRLNLQTNLSEKHLSVLTELEELLTPKNNFKNYRLELKKLMASHSLMDPPILPYLGVHLRDVTFTDDGNSDMDETGMINFGKMRIFGDILGELKNFQGQSYSIEEADPTILKFLKNLNFMELEDLYSRSGLARTSSNKNLLISALSRTNSLKNLTRRNSEKGFPTIPKKA